MSRKKTIDQAMLFKETEKLIMESGYSGFHFKALSARLGVARSTIYNYYTKKEELVTDYMVHLLEKAVAQMDNVDKKEEPVKELIRLWSKYANMHQMLQIMPYIDKKASPMVEENTKKMFDLFIKMKTKIEETLKDGQMKGIIREDIHMKTIVGLVMSTVQIPVHHDTLDEWVNEVYQLLMSGLKK
ncbi:TetR/AcrR family transcriptional regulator [Salipaludibacillus sp. CF4.18]|uniref:TetR/AcrR family transcriptional regulator n=1 Tax=Salipaludibacillus sp. CF4.18 TaxID=3373081 RepID=UPI003EE785C1